MALGENVNYVDNDRPTEGVINNPNRKDLKPEVWITAYPIPYESKTMIVK